MRLKLIGMLARSPWEAKVDVFMNTIGKIILAAAAMCGAILAVLYMELATPPLTVSQMEIPWYLLLVGIPKQEALGISNLYIECF